MLDYLFRNLFGLLFLACSFIASLKAEAINFASLQFLILAVYCFLMSELLEIKDKLKWKTCHDSNLP